MDIHNTTNYSGCAGEFLEENRKCLGSFKIPIRYELNASDREKARHLLNKHHVGSEKISFDLIVPEELKNAHYNIASVKESFIEVNLYSDGSLVRSFIG